jgi:hypothetical protein
MLIAVGNHKNRNMNLVELKELLQQHNVSKDMYVFDEEYPNESYCLRFNGHSWEVYYSERGIKSGLKYFENESEACNYFFGQLIKEKLNPNLWKRS